MKNNNLKEVVKSKIIVGFSESINRKVETELQKQLKLGYYLIKTVMTSAYDRNNYKVEVQVMLLFGEK